MFQTRVQMTVAAALLGPFLVSILSHILIPSSVTPSTWQAYLRLVLDKNGDQEKPSSSMRTSIHECAEGLPGTPVGLPPAAPSRPSLPSPLAHGCSGDSDFVS